jgi:hypothetical protein
MTDAPSNEDTKTDGMASLLINWRRYEEYVTDADFPDEDKKAVITGLMELMIAFVDLQWDVHSLDNACEQVGENRIILPDHLLKLNPEQPDNQKHQADGDVYRRPSAEEKS